MDFASAIGGMAADAALVDEQKPSLFELLSEQQLHGLLPPTLRYLLTILTQRYPRYLLRALNSFDELYALAMLVVEHYYLRTRGGTFTEHFYGLKREQVLQTGGEVPRAAAGTPDAIRNFLQISNRSSSLWKNLAIVVGVPYLKRKLDEAYELDAPRARLGTAYQRMPANPTWRDRFRHYARWFLRNIYPSVHAAYGFAVLAFHLAYLFDGTRYANPLLWLVGTRIRRMTAADYRAIDDMENAAAAATKDSSLVGSKLLGGLSVVLPASIFALKFLEWWHASDFAKQLSHKATAHLDLPAPVVTGLPAAPAGNGAAAAGASKAATTTTSSGTPGIKSILKKDTASTSRVSGETPRPVTPATAAPATLEDDVPTPKTEEEELALAAPIAKPSLLPILTVPTPSDSALCPICGDDITAPTACQTGVVYCYTCIHKWVAGQHDKQESFLADKAGRWESGIGRCAVTGRRVLGGTEGLRRLMV